MHSVKQGRELRSLNYTDWGATHKLANKGLGLCVLEALTEVGGEEPDGSFVEAVVLEISVVSITALPDLSLSAFVLNSILALAVRVPWPFLPPWWLFTISPLSSR